MELAHITVEYDGRRIICTTVIGADARHLGLAPIRVRQLKVQPHGPLDGCSAGDVVDLVVRAAQRLGTEAGGAWEGTAHLW